MDIAKRHQDQLDRIKKNTEKSFTAFRKNYINWHKWKKFIYVTSLSEDDIAVLKNLGKPQLEFNILEAYISRQKGEFSKQVPSFAVSATSERAVNPEVVKVVEDYLRSREAWARKNNTAYSVYDDMLSGGFSVMKVWTDYKNNRSFDQDIYHGRVFDPTLCGFDPIAKESHKGDGDYCFENTIMREEDFLKEFDIDISKLSYGDYKVNGPFQWSYRNNEEKLILVNNYFEKEKKRQKIVELADRSVMTVDNYKDFLQQHEASGMIEQPPQVVQERMVDAVNVARYRVIENRVIDYKKTDFFYLPLVFFDANSVTFRNTLQSEVQQVTRPYCYQAMGVQRLKNFCGQTLANEIENMIQHKFKVPIEGIPEQYKEAYTDIQKPSVMVYNQFRNDNPEVRLDPPQEIARVPTPPEVAASFREADQTTQVILGTYDAALGIQKKELSGVAIVEGATQSNAAAMPIIVGYMAGLNQIARIYVDLIPKYIITPRSLPRLDKEGKTSMAQVNDYGQPNMRFDPQALEVNVEAGVNFSVQRTRALQVIISLMQASPTFSQFINTTPQGLNALLDNIEMRGIESLKEGVDQFIQKMQQQQAQQPNPQAMKAQVEQGKLKLQEAKLNVDMHQAERRNQIDTGSLAVQDKQADTQRLAVLSKIDDAEARRESEEDKIQAEKEREIVDLALKATDQSHRHNKEILEMAKPAAAPQELEEDIK